MPRNRPLQICIAAAVLLLVAGTAGAVRPITPEAPPLPDPAAWVNSSPFTLERLKGRRVVLLAFINAYSVNSVRTFKHLHRWWETYALRGLMVIGIHSPDFDFDRDPLKVRAAVKRFGIKFPVLIDSRKTTWEAYGVEGWPTYFLIDHKGRIIHDRVGEGGYDDFEEEILLALERFNAYRPPEDYRIPRPPLQERCGDVTAPFFLGSRRGTKPATVRPKKLMALTESRNGELAVLGDWTVEKEALRYSGAPSGLKDHFRLVYKGAECLATINRFEDKPAKLFIKQDNLWLHAGNANKDVQWDDEDRSYILVDEPRLYYLTKDKKKNRLRQLQLFPSRTGIGLSSFEFSNHCQTDYIHR